MKYLIIEDFEKIGEVELETIPNKGDMLRHEKKLYNITMITHSVNGPELSIFKHDQDNSDSMDTTWN